MQQYIKIIMICYYNIISVIQKILIIKKYLIKNRNIRYDNLLLKHRINYTNEYKSLKMIFNINLYMYYFKKY